MFDTSGVDYLPVVEKRDSNKVIARVSHIAALDRFNKGLIDANVEEHR
jgi:hypothetical protein